MTVLADRASQWVIEAKPGEDSEGGYVLVSFFRMAGEGTTIFGRPVKLYSDTSLAVTLNINVDEQGDPSFSWGQPMAFPKPTEE